MPPPKTKPPHRYVYVIGPTVSLPYLQVYRSRGRAYAYYRRDGRQVRIKGAPGAADFAGAYEAARKAWEAAPIAAGPSAPRDGTIASLIAAYKDAPEFRRLAPKTQRDYTRTLDLLTTRFGSGLVMNATRAWVYRLRDEMQDKPRSANYRVAIICAVLTFAVRRGLRQDNPALKVEKLHSDEEGFRAWTATEFAAMTLPAAGDVALPVLIARYTAQRQADILTLPWSAYDGATITLRQGKGRKHNRADAPLVLPVPIELRQVLDAIRPRPGLLICLTSKGAVWKADWFRHRFAQVRAGAGLPLDCQFHGLRVTRLTELADHGASDAEIQATSGHRTRSMVAHYTRSAQQKALAASGVARLPKAPDSPGRHGGACGGTSARATWW